MRPARLGNLWIFGFLLAAAPLAAQSSVRANASSGWKRPSDSELKKKLTPIQFAVTRKDATESPYHNEFWNNHDAGIYVDVISGRPLFSSLDKYDSHTGWPSFTRPLDPAQVRLLTDRTLGFQRTEVRSSLADSHLGHLFDDGPAPLGKRYCMNSAALRFVPAAKLAEEGYGQYAALFAARGSPHPGK